jgi:hypothetical protein
MTVEEAKTVLFGPKPTPDDAVIYDVLERLAATAHDLGYAEGHYAELMAGTDDE